VTDRGAYLVHSGRMDIITFLAAFAALHGTHDLADHWVQRHADAMRKDEPGRAGRLHCLSHVLSYLLTQMIVLAVIGWLADLDVTPLAYVAGMVVNGATHYFADRRKPLRWLASLIPGKLAYWDNGGAYPLDQSWHKFWLTVSALIIAL
jgi:hypothetical protein